MADLSTVRSKIQAALDEEVRLVNLASASLQSKIMAALDEADSALNPPSTTGTPGLSGTTVTFTEGVPARVSLAGLLPAGADRYLGHWDTGVDGFTTASNIYNWFPGVYFDPATKEMVYDGRPMTDNDNVTPLSPNPHYAVGYEAGPYNAHWTYPPTQQVTPKPVAVNGVTTAQSIYGASKHTRAVYCPWDQKLRVYGGDYGSWGLQNVKYGGQDGRMLMWKVDPVTQTWSLDYPAKGRAGDQIPLQSDRMNMDWDATRQFFWVAHGSVRPGPAGYLANEVLTTAQNPTRGGYAPEYYWKGDGGLADAWPATVDDDALPVFIYDPKGTTSFKLAVWDGTNPPLLVPWVQSKDDSVMMGTAYDDTSKRWYAMQKSGFGVILHWLDTTNYETSPSTLAWQSLQIDLRVGDPYNLTGVDRSNIYGPENSPMFVDNTNRVMYFFDVTATPALLAVALPGNTSHAVHSVIQIADLTSAIGYDIAHKLMALGSVSVSPIIWVPEHRCIVWCQEPQEHNVGPYTRSLQIDVDTGVISNGIRLPNSNEDGMTWFPDTGVWFPPSDEICTYGRSATINPPIIGGNRSWDVGTWNIEMNPTVWNRYKWVA